MLFLTLSGLETPISLMLLSSKGEEKIEGGKKGKKIQALQPDSDFGMGQSMLKCFLRDRQTMLVSRPQVPTQG